MAMDVGASKGGPKSDINVTPLVDVMLVLLIIMMIVAPLLQQGVALTLPIANNSSEKPETQEDTVVAITADGRFHVNGQAVQEGDLRRRVTHRVGIELGELARGSCSRAERSRLSQRIQRLSQPRLQLGTLPSHGGGSGG